MHKSKELIFKCLTFAPARKFHRSNVFKKPLLVRDAVRTAMTEEMERDDKVFLMGEEVAAAGGAYLTSVGMLKQFGPERVWDTPITEMGFAGLACGAGYYGLKPIVEFMSWNFAMQGIDHIINSAAKINYMSAGDLTCPIVFRGPNGWYGGVAAQHTQDYATWYGQVPGLLVLAPYDSEDARGLLKSAIRDPNPVVFLENEVLYKESFEVDDKVLSKDFLLPIGQAKIQRPGKDVTIVSYSRGLGTSLQAAKELAKEKIDAEVINLRSIRPLDMKTIIESVKKTKRLVTVEEGFPHFGVGAEIIAAICESDAYDVLKAAPERVTGLDIPMPYAQNLESKSLPTPRNVINAVKRVIKTN